MRISEIVNQQVRRAECIVHSECQCHYYIPGVGRAGYNQRFLLESISNDRQNSFHWSFEK